MNCWIFHYKVPLNASNQITFWKRKVKGNFFFTNWFTFSSEKNCEVNCRKVVLGEKILWNKQICKNRIILLSTKTKNQRINNGENLQTAQHTGTKDWANPPAYNQKSQCPSPIYIYSFFYEPWGQLSLNSSHSLMYFHLPVPHCSCFFKLVKGVSVVHVYS